MKKKLSESTVENRKKTAKHYTELAREHMATKKAGG
jgi:hypothetical protein